VRQRGRRLGRRWQAGGDGGAALKVEDDEQAGMETRVALGGGRRQTESRNRGPITLTI
jgi:hypothetical protein